MISAAPVIRLLFNVPADFGAPDFVARLRAAGFSPVEQRGDDDYPELVWRASDPALDCELVLVESDRMGGVGHADFRGADCIDLAARAAPALRYLPVELLHVVARHAE